MNTLLRWLYGICLDGVMREPCHIRALKSTEVEVSSRGLPLLPLLVRWIDASLARGIIQHFLLVDNDRVSLTVHTTEINIKSLLLVT